MRFAISFGPQIVNAIAPYDFLITQLDGNEIAVDVKSTGGEFESALGSRLRRTDRNDHGTPL